MFKLTKLVSFLVSTTLILTLCACNKNENGNSYEKEDAAGTGYGTSAKSALYIEDFFFLTVGTPKTTVEVLLGSAHYHNENNEFTPVYSLQNGDAIKINYNEKDNTVLSAEYTYSKDMEKENFFDILVDLEILKSKVQENTEQNNTNIQDQQNQEDVLSPTPPESGENPVVQDTIQGDIFASGSYVYSLIESFLKPNAARSDILLSVGKPNYFFSHSFKENTYIIDCYNLSDGSKLYLDYGFERMTLRAAAIYKSGTITSIFDTPWSEQSMPTGYTRRVSDVAKVNRLSKNMTPAKVYAYIGEPSWYEGTRGSYTDVFKLNDGRYAHLNFGSAHNKLTSVSIKTNNGEVTVINLK